jgi:hypothetical protein
MMLLKVVWRPYYKADAVAQLTAMGTIERNETYIDCDDVDHRWGDGVAAEVARLCHADDSTCYLKGGSIVILEPASIAGTYMIHTDWDPSFSATQLHEESP